MSNEFTRSFAKDLYLGLLPGDDQEQYFASKLSCSLRKAAMLGDKYRLLLNTSSSDSMITDLLVALREVIGTPLDASDVLTREERKSVSKIRKEYAGASSDISALLEILDSLAPAPLAEKKRRIAELESELAQLKSEL